ncbi:DUF2953 domain-containing protein [Salinibacillus kushneri]|uniref:DUF2953 domain-containing protein n=1 Tax=Salinibacillus kushneri TaxID=237682 RepID=UPI0015A688D8|nr:DUF2953 domain-containing protein [Salinibacillus kushneri]
MNWWALILIILAILILLIMSLLCTRLYISVTYTHKQDKDYLNIHLQIWKFIRIHREMLLEDMNQSKAMPSFPDEKQNGERKGFFNRFLQAKNGFHTIQQLFPVIKNFVSKIKVSNFYWDTQIGIENDASFTGMISGLLWSVKGSLTGIMNQHMRVSTPLQIYIQPNFQRDMIYTHLECMFSFRIGQAMYAILKIARKLKSE